MCFYLSWWRSFQGASARDNAKGVEIMKLMIVCIMRDKNLNFILWVLVNNETYEAPLLCYVGNSARDTVLTQTMARDHDGSCWLLNTQGAISMG